MKRLLLPLLAALTLPTAVNSGEKFDITCFWNLENAKPDDSEAIDRFVIDTDLDKGSLIAYEKPPNGKKKLSDKYMVTYKNSPSQIEVIIDLGYDLGTSYIFDKKNVENPKVTDLVKEYGQWYDSPLQTKYKYFNCKKTPMFFFK